MNKLPASQETAAAYIHRTHLLVRQACQSGERISIEDFVEYMLAYRHRVCKKTIIQYYASITYTLGKTALRISGLSDEKVEWAKEKLRTADLSICPTPTHTSAKRRKRVDKEDYLAVYKYLIQEARRGRKNDTSLNTSYFLAAGMVTGLRPSEWLNANLTKRYGHYCLHTKTGKTRPPVYRDIPINSDEDAEVIQQHLTLMKPYITAGPKDAQRYITSCRSRLRNAVVKILGSDSHLALYDCRHQFTANMRGAGVEKETLKEWMGHENCRTTRMYGNKASSWCGSPIVRTRKQSTPNSSMRATLKA